MEGIIKQFEQIGFKLTKEYTEETQTLRLERVDFEGETQYIDIDNYTWELNEPDFDPKNGSIGDWLVESYCLAKDKDGSRLIWAYALTGKEIVLLGKLIAKLDELYGTKSGGDKDNS